MGEHITIQASSVTELRAQLEELGEPSLRDFNARLVPTESADTLLGIRIPTLRQLAQELWRHNRPLADAFLADLPTATWKKTFCTCCYSTSCGRLTATLLRWNPSCRTSPTGW
ncbi:MAG: hypothetical protein U1U88_001052 [Lawsonella clevelandensis]